MSNKESLFEKYKIVRENEEEIETQEVEEPIVGAEPQDEEICLPEDELVLEFSDEENSLKEESFDNEEVSESKQLFEYKFKDNEEIDDIVNGVLEKDEPIQRAEIPVIVSPLETQTAKVEEKVEETKADEVIIAEEEIKPEVIILEEPMAEEVVTEEAEKGTETVPEPVAEEKPKKQKKVKEPKAPKEKKEKAELAEPVTKKDYATLLLAVIAVVLALSFVVVKYFPKNNDPTVEGEQTTIAEQDLANIQISREGSLRNFVQSDIPSIFYQFSSDYSLQYYQYRDSRMVPVKTTGTLSATVDFGPAKLPVTIDYVKLGDDIFGIGLFRPDQHPNVKLYNVKLVLFKLTNLPKAYASNGKALLLANVATSADLEKDVNAWTESYTVDLASGKCSRFISVGSRTIDPTTGAYVAGFGVLTKVGYNATSGKIPFLSARYYEAGAGKDDVFVKDGTKESAIIKGIVNKKMIVDGNAVIFMRYTNSGFNVYRYENGKESVVLQFTGSTNRCVFADEYILDKEKGVLYNLKTGKETLLVGYKMTSPELMKVSPDGKYLVVMGLMDNIMDYQVHIFDLQTGDVAKYLEDNYSNVNNLSKNLSFINNNTVMYMLPDPNRGRECVILDLSKAFK